MFESNSPTYEMDEGGLQFLFNQSRAKIQMMAGGYANGKTAAGAIKAIQIAADYPGSAGLLARATYPKLDTTLRREFFKWCPKHWIKRMPTKDNNTVIFKNNSYIDFRYIQQRGKHQADGQGTSNLLSATYDFILIDQVEDPEITHKDFLDLAGRLRGSTPYRPEGEADPTMPNTGPRWMMLTCNPTANWVYKELVRPLKLYLKDKIKADNLSVDPISGEPIMELFEGSTYTNRAHLEDDFIRSLEALYHGQMRKRFLMGEWAAFEGLVYPEFDISIHGLTREQIIWHIRDCYSRHVKLKMVEAYDFGLSNPTCYMLAVVDDWGRVIVVDGFYEPNYSYLLHKPRIDKIRMEWMDICGVTKMEDPINADPSIYKQKVINGQNTGDTVAKLLQDDGLNMRPANNDIISGIAKVGAYFADREDFPHVLGPEFRACGPLMYVNKELEWYQNEVTNYYWKRDTSNRIIDEPQEHDDHAMDTSKYMLSFLPSAAEVSPPRPAEPPAWMQWQEVELNHS